MYPGPCGTSGLQTHATRTLVHLGSLGVWGSYKIAVSTKYIMTRTKAHFNGISNPSNQSISSFLFPAAPAASPVLLPPSWILNLFSRFSGSFKASTCYIVSLPGPVKTPGEKYLAEISHSPTVKSVRNARRPGTSCSSNKKPQKTVFLYRGVWEFDARRPVRARELIPSLSTGYTQ